MIQRRHTVVYGVNPGSAESHRRFREKHSLPYSLLVDEGQQVARLYRSNGLIVKRTVYLIGRDGKIRFAQRGMPKPSAVMAFAD